MRRQKIDSQRERRILIALVVSKHFLSQASRVIDLDLISTTHFRIVAQWCLEYFAQYGKAPGKHIEDLYHHWSEDNDDSDSVEAVKDFLDSLGKQYEREGELNIPYLLEELRDFLAKRKMQKLRDDLDYSLNSGKVEEAEKTLVDYRRVQVGQSSGVDPLNDREVWRRTFASPLEPLIVFEGEAGRFLNPAMTRDAFVGVQAPEKSGKTFWCVEFALRALLQRRRVALFEVGDLSESQIMMRLAVRWTSRPLYKWQLKKPILIPQRIIIDESEDLGYRIEGTSKREKKVVDHLSTIRAVRKFRRSCGMAKKTTYIRSSTHPSGTINVQGISSILDQWAQEHNFIADVIIIDYADILAPENPREKEKRHQINDTWMALRRLSQERHALVIAPTQSNKETYEAKGGRLQKMGNVSEDKRKFAHVTGMLALNRTPEEVEIGGMRLNWLVLREAPFNTRIPLYVGNCFTLGRALCCAKYSSRITESSDN